MWFVFNFHLNINKQIQNKFSGDFRRNNIELTQYYLQKSWMVFAFKPIQDGPFQGCSRMDSDKKAPLPKICHKYPTMMKLGTLMPYLKKIQKTYKSSDSLYIFSPEIIKFCCSNKNRCRLYFDTLFLILLTFFESLKIFFNKYGYNFDDVSKNGLSRPSIK